MFLSLSSIHHSIIIRKIGDLILFKLSKSSTILSNNEHPNLHKSKLKIRF